MRRARARCPPSRRRRTRIPTRRCRARSTTWSRSRGTASPRRSCGRSRGCSDRRPRRARSSSRTRRPRTTAAGSRTCCRRSASPPGRRPRHRWRRPPVLVRSAANAARSSRQPESAATWPARYRCPARSSPGCKPLADPPGSPENAPHGARGGSRSSLRAARRTGAARGRVLPRRGRRQGRARWAPTVPARPRCCGSSPGSWRRTRARSPCPVGSASCGRWSAPAPARWPTCSSRSRHHGSGPRPRRSTGSS